MQTETYSIPTERTMQLVNALASALVAMRLTDGCAITMLGVRGRLNFVREIENMVEALRLLGVDVDSITPTEAALNWTH